MKATRRVLGSTLANILWGLAILFALVGPAVRPAAAEERFAAGDYDVVRWTTDDGLPGNVVRALAQTPDGYLWIGCWGGLARYDGVRFEIFDPASTPELGGTDINALAVDANGTLWIVTYNGALCTYQDGRFEQVRANPKVCAHQRTIAPAADGRVWVGGRFLDVWDGREMRRVMNLNAWGLHAAANGDLWVANFDGIHRIREGRLVHSDPSIVPAYGFSEEGDGSLLVHAVHVLARLPGEKHVATTPPRHLRTWQLWGSTLDRTGSRWWAVQSGLYRLPPASENEPFAWSQVEHALPFQVTGPARAVLEADDGSMWVATEAKGLMRLLPRAARPLALPNVSSVVPMADGSVWVADIGRPRIVRLDGDRIVEEHGGLPEAHVSRARGGGIWIAHHDGFARLRDGNLERFDRPEGRDRPEQPLFEDSSGRLWWWDAEGSVCLENGRVVQSIEGRIWGEGRRGLLVGMHSGSPSWGWLTSSGIEVHPDLDRMPSGPWRCLFEDSRGNAWVAHPGAGLSCFHSNGRAVLTTAHGLPANQLGSIVEDDQRRLWINSNRGVFVAALEELMAVVEGRASFVPCRLVSRNEMSYRESAWSPGKLYANTLEGYVVIDTRAEDPPHDPPAARVQEFRVGGRRMPLTAAVELPLDERTVRLRFTAPALTDARLLRFQYRLVGVEEAWVEGTIERVAAYHHLRPGAYEFQVRAAGRRGIWGETARLAFVVPPRLDETTWFRGLLALLVVGAGVWVYRTTSRSRRRQRRALEAEVGQHRAEEAARTLSRRLMTAQEDERARIALELHDDISQRLAVLVLRLRTRADDVEGNQQFGQALASDVHRISHALHPSRLEEAGLGPALRTLARETKEAGGFEVEVSSTDGVDAIERDAALALYRIAQEAVSNAIRHGSPTKVAIAVRTEGQEVVLAVEDDGAGFDPAAPDSKGGLGLFGMHERARALGGTVELSSRAGAGTRILARVPRRRQEA